MPFVELQPLAKTPEALSTYLDLNLRRLADALATLGRVEQITTTVTGSLTIDSGIPVVKNVVACLAEAPVADACLVTAELDPSDTQNVIVKVYDNVFVQSVQAIDVNVIIVGDDPPARPARSS